MSSANHLRALQQPTPMLMDARQLQLQEEEDEESTSTSTFDVYESPCTIKASNEEYSPQDIDAFAPCTTDFYGGCVEEASVLDNDDTIKILDVAFDYELYYSVGSNITRTLAYFEGTMLEHISAVTGLTECDNRRLDVLVPPVELDLDLVDRRLPRYHDFSDEELLLFSGLTSEPLDQVDTDMGACTVNVASDAKNGAICQPFNGLLRAYLKNDPPLSPDALISVHAGILKLVRHGMLQELYVSGNIKQAIFVGTRPDDPGLNGFSNQEGSSLNSSNNTNNTDSRAVGLIGGFAGILVISLLVALFVVRKKNKKESSKHAGNFPIEARHDSCPDPMPGVTKSGSSTIDGSQESVGQPAPSPHWLSSQDPNQTQPREVLSFECPKPPVSELTITCDTSPIGVPDEPDQPLALDHYSLGMPASYEDDESTAYGMPSALDMPDRSVDYC